MIRTFKPGEIYTYTSWFTGGMHSLKVLAATDDSVTVAAHYSELDGEHDLEPETLTTEIRDGRQAFAVQSYHDSTGYVTAGMDAWGNVID